MKQELVKSPIGELEIRQRIKTIRGVQVMLDSDLAALYQVPTMVFNQSVKRNAERFPPEFRFQLTKGEFDRLTSQIVISKKQGRGGRRHLPFVFTEQGVAMLSGVLRSKIAVKFRSAKRGGAIAPL